MADIKNWFEVTISAFRFFFAAPIPCWSPHFIFTFCHLNFFPNFYLLCLCLCILNDQTQIVKRKQKKKKKYERRSVLPFATAATAAAAVTQYHCHAVDPFSRLSIYKTVCCISKSFQNRNCLNILNAMVNFIAACLAACSISSLVTLHQPVKIYKRVTLTECVFPSLSLSFTLVSRFGREIFFSVQRFR